VLLVAAKSDFGHINTHYTFSIERLPPTRRATEDHHWTKVYIKIIEILPVKFLARTRKNHFNFVCFIKHGKVYRWDY